MRKIFAVVLVLFLIGLVAESTAQSSNLRIAFNTPEDSKADDYEIYTMALDGSGIKNITNNKDVAWTYYSHGGRLFFVSDRDVCKRCYMLHESDADGKNIKKITNLQLEDAWMGSRNNGKEMIVSGRIGTAIRYQLFFVNTETGHFRQITNEPAAAFRDPTFSPDGKKIAYIYKKNRTDRAEFEELYVMNADGSDRKKLTTYPATVPLAKEFGYKAGPPQWNGKYKFITYQSEQNGGSSIYAVTPDGKKQWRIDTGKIAAGWHDWSPDGEWLAFDARDAATGRYDIYLMNYKTKAIKKITGGSAKKVHQAPVFVEVK